MPCRLRHPPSLPEKPAPRNNENMHPHRAQDDSSVPVVQRCQSVLTVGSRADWLEHLTGSLKRITPRSGPHLKIGIVGALGTGDVGDEAMLCSFMAELEARLGKPTLIVFSMGPAVTKAYVGIECLPTAHRWMAERESLARKITSALHRVESGLTRILGRFLSIPEIIRDGWACRISFRMVTRRARAMARGLEQGSGLRSDGFLADHVRVISELDALIYLGGGYLNSWHVKADTYLFLLSAEVALELGIPTYASGINLGPLNRLDRRWVAPVLNRFELIGCRDRKQSFELAEAMGIRADGRLHYSSDDAICLASEPTTALEKLVSDLGSYLALQVHYWRLDDTRWHAFVNRLADAVQNYACARHLAVLMIPMTFGESAEAFDQAALLEVAALAGSGVRFELAPPNCRPSELKFLFGMAASALVTRHHAMVFSVASGVRTVAISYDQYYRQKLDGVAEDFGEICEVVDCSLSAAEIVRKLARLNPK
jgi:polysaccharide pyruvyl transferase WcaK-like protein